MTTIVMTGGTSGLGEAAAQHIRKARGVRLLLGARNQSVKGATTVPLDLAKLNSVRSFVTEVSTKLAGTSIDVLVLNAGLSFMTADNRTEDGFETTFAVNHLAHYLLVRLLLPRMAANGRIVITTSGTHDPAEKTAIPPPHHANAELLAHPDRDPQRDPSPRTAGQRAYGASKLCNVLTARALALQPEVKDRNILVIAFDPGPTPGTGLVRNSGAALNFVWRLLGTPLSSLAPRLNNRKAVGRALASLALGEAPQPKGAYYAVVRKNRLLWKLPSEYAQRDDVMQDLWRDSAHLVGLNN